MNDTKYIGLDVAPHPATVGFPRDHLPPPYIREDGLPYACRSAQPQDNSAQTAFRPAIF
jgi:hypothetical protein